jgi:hypothetical protein
MSSLLQDYKLQSDFANEENISEKTASRYRAEGLPWVRWRGKIWIHIPGSKQFLANRTASQTAQKVKAAKVRAKKSRHQAHAEGVRS